MSIFLVEISSATWYSGNDNKLITRAYTYKGAMTTYRRVEVQNCKYYVYSLNVWVYATKLYILNTIRTQTLTHSPFCHLKLKIVRRFRCWWWFSFHFEKKKWIFLDIRRGIEHLLVFPISTSFLYTLPFIIFWYTYLLPKGIPTCQNIPVLHKMLIIVQCSAWFLVFQ